MSDEENKLFESNVHHSLKGNLIMLRNQPSLLRNCVTSTLGILPRVSTRSLTHWVRSNIVLVRAQLSPLPLAAQRLQTSSLTNVSASLRAFNLL
jgi:hypothetical protein